MSIHVMKVDGKTIITLTDKLAEVYMLAATFSGEKENPDLPNIIKTAMLVGIASGCSYHCRFEDTPAPVELTELALGAFIEGFHQGVKSEME